MRAALTLASAVSLAAVASVAVAQAPQVNEQAQQLTKGLPGSPGVQFGDFSEPFKDPGNETAKAIAALEGISVGEATRRLRLEHNAARLQHRLRQSHPDTFAGVTVQPGSSRVVARFSDVDSAAGLGRVRQSTEDAELLGATTVERTSRSARENLSRGDAVGNALQGLGLIADIAVNPGTGETRILARNPQAVRNAIEQGRLSVPEGTTVEQFAGITETADIHGGRVHNGGDTGQGCSTGFVVQQRTGPDVGISTAGHCDNRARYSTVASTDYNSAGTLLTFRDVEWYGARPDGYARDVQWHNASYSTNQFPVKFFNGTS